MKQVAASLILALEQQGLGGWYQQGYEIAAAEPAVAGDPPSPADVAAHARQQQS